MLDQSVWGLTPILLLFVLMIWMITSQRRRQREIATMQAALAVGDDVLSVGGIMGRIVSDEGAILGLEVAPGVVIRVERRAISGRASDVPERETPPPTDATPTERPPHPDDETRA